MDKKQTVAALGALAQDNRLDVLRLLARAGPDGISAGRVAAILKIAPNTLTFHFDRLRRAGLVSVRRAGRSMIYAARFDRMHAVLGYLSENCGARVRAEEVVATRAPKEARKQAGRKA